MEISARKKQSSGSYLGTKDAAALSGYTSDHITRLARSGKLLAYRENNRWWVDRDSLKLFMLNSEAQERTKKMKMRDGRRHEIVKRRFLKARPLVAKTDVLVFSIGDRLEAFWIATASTALVALLLFSGLHLAFRNFSAEGQLSQVAGFSSNEWEQSPPVDFVGVVATSSDF